MQYMLLTFNVKVIKYIYVVGTVCFPVIDYKTREVYSFNNNSAE